MGVVLRSGTIPTPMAQGPGRLGRLEDGPGTWRMRHLRGPSPNAQSACRSQTLAEM